MHPPLISVVIPVRNRPDQIADAIQSALAQSCPHLEVIVVDDGSDDGVTPTRIAELAAASDPRRPVRAVFLSGWSGSPAARNAGAAPARGSCLAFLDSDDRWTPDFLSAGWQALSQAGTDHGAAVAAREIRDAAGKTRRLVPVIHADDLSQKLPYENVVGATSAVLMRRDTFEQIGGFDTTLPACQDWDLWIRLAAITRFAAIPSARLIYDGSPSGRITTNARRRLAGHLAIWRRHLRPRRPSPAQRAAFAATIGDILMEMARPRSARRLFLGAFRARPNPRTAVQTLLSMLGSPALYRRVRGLAGRRLA